VVVELDGCGAGVVGVTVGLGVVGVAVGGAGGVAVAPCVGLTAGS
jgi:hypothetical protein